MRGFEIYPQAHCHACSVPVGFHGQSPAYSGTDGNTYCERDVEQSWKETVDAAIASGRQQDAAKKRRALRARTEFLAITRKPRARKK